MKLDKFSKRKHLCYSYCYIRSHPFLKYVIIYAVQRIRRCTDGYVLCGDEIKKRSEIAHSTGSNRIGVCVCVCPHLLPQDKGRSILWNVVIFMILRCYSMVQTVSIAKLSGYFVLRRTNWFISVCLIGADIGQICRTFCITTHGAPWGDLLYTTCHDFNTFSTFSLKPTAPNIYHFQKWKSELNILAQRYIDLLEASQSMKFWISV
jgi:hypothetical protein